MVSVWLLGTEGPSSSSGLRRERLGQWREFWTGGIQLIHIEESISNFRTEQRLIQMRSFEW